MNYKLAHDLRLGISKDFISQSVKKRNKFSKVFGWFHSFSKNWILHQLYGEMTVEKYGRVWSVDHCYPLSNNNFFDEKDWSNYTRWYILRPMYCNEKTL